MPLLETDFLIIGSGLAGQTFALNVAKHGSTTLLCKSHLLDTNTYHAQGGIASVLSEKDNFESHIQDTLVAGDGVCNEATVRFMVSKAPEAIRELTALGVEFTRNCQELDLGLEGGHSAHRIVHAKDQTGREVQNKLAYRLLAENINVFEHHHAFELIVQDAGCCGVYALNLLTNEVICFRAKVVFLASGGAGQVYLHTTNPEVATGDGIALAHQAGVAIKDMEFVQFHPTLLYSPGFKPFLISEAVRGFGADLKNKAGRAFMKDYHPLGALAPRDIVSRAIVSEMKATGESSVYLDLRSTDTQKAKNCFPNIFKSCIERGIDPAIEMIPVVPAAHYVCGGVITDIKGRTSLANLYAGGEVACTGVHGANRLASNSLLEAAVFSKEAALDSIKVVKTTEKRILQKQKEFQVATSAISPKIKSVIQQLMWQCAGIIRREAGLQQALNQTIEIEKQLPQQTIINPQLLEIKNLITVARLILVAALERKESKGGHYREDFSSFLDKKCTIEPVF